MRRWGGGPGADPVLDVEADTDLDPVSGPRTGAAGNLTDRPASGSIRAMHETSQATVKEMVVQIGVILRRQAELYAEQQKLLDELSALRAEKDELLATTQQVRLAESA